MSEIPSDYSKPPWIKMPISELTRFAPASTWRAPDRTGMRYPEQSDLSGGATDCAPAHAVDERTADSGHLAAASNGSPGGESRLRRKLEKRDQRIAGMKRRIEALEHALATRTMDLESLSRNVERAVTHALCNVRMIPVHGFGRDPKIVEVKLTDAPRRSAATSPDADGQMKKD